MQLLEETRIVKEALSTWRENAKLSRRRREIEASAINFNRAKVVSHYYNFWCIRKTQKSISKSDLLWVEKSFYGEKLIKKAYQRWAEVHQKLEKRSLEVAADNFCNENLAYGGLVTWKQALDFKRVKDPENSKLATKFHLKKMVTVWRAQVRESKARQEQAEILARNHYRELVSKVYWAWRQETVRNRPVRKRIEAYECKLLASCVSAWRTWNKDMKVKEREIMVNTKCVNLQWTV